MLKNHKDIIIIGCLFFAGAYFLQVVSFWEKIGLSEPKGLYLQGGLFLVLMVVLKNFVFEPYLNIDQERSDQTQGKRQKAVQSQEQAEQMMQEYTQAIASAKIKAIQTKQAIAMDAEDQEKKTLAHARQVSDEHLQKELKEIHTQAQAAQTDLEKDVSGLASSIMKQVLQTKST